MIRRFALGLAVVSLACQSAVTPGTPCARAADCPGDLVCTFGACHAQCTQPRDCPLGARCLAGTRVCSLDTENHCDTHVCPSPLVCAADECRTICTGAGDCLAGVCTGGSCVEPTSGTDAGPPIDAGPDAPTPIDVGTDAPPPIDVGTDANLDAPDAFVATCSPTAVFGAPQSFGPVSMNSGFETLSPDELELFVGSNGPPGVYYGIFRSSRGMRTTPFATASASAVTALNGPSDRSEPSLADDGGTLYLTTSVSGSSCDHDILVGVRSALGVVDFSAPASVSVDTTAFERTPFLASGGTLWFARAPCPSGSNYDIHYAAAATPPAMFGTVTPATSLNSSSDELAPVLSADRLTIYFASNRTGSTGSLDVWRATRTTTSSTFGTPVRVPELSTAYDDFPRWISADGCRLYLTQFEAGAFTQLVLATRTP